MYDATADRVYRYLLSRVAVPAVAEDLTSEVFLKAWTRLHQYRPGSRPFVAWLFRVARNAMIDDLRRERRSIGSGASSPDGKLALVDAMGNPEEHLRAREVHAALRCLTEDQRRVLELRFFGGLTTGEIARTMGKREGAVRALQMRGLQALAARLSHESN